MTGVSELTADDFQRVRQLVYRKTGMSFDDSKQAYVIKRVPKNRLSCSTKRPSVSIIACSWFAPCTAPRPII